MRRRLAAALVALPLLNAPGAKATPIASCNVHVEAGNTAMTVDVDGSTTNLGFEEYFNIWKVEINGAWEDGSAANYLDEAYTRTIDRSYFVWFTNGSSGHAHVELDLVGAPRDLACHAAQDVAWSPTGIVILPD
jgi:hypothetical protein